MNPLRNHRMSWALTALVLALPVAVSAQQTSGPKKLYCWDEGGRRVCSDALPPSAVGKQRTEFDQKTGTAVNRVARALTEAERAQLATEEQARKSQEEQRRREMAMVATFATEEDLRRSFQERFLLVDESLKGAALAQANLHKSLISLLRQANELELQSKPVGKVLREKIHKQHAELQGLRTMQQRQQAERALIDSEFQQALARYRALKLESAGIAPAPDATATPAPASGG